MLRDVIQVALPVAVVYGLGMVRVTQRALERRRRAAWRSAMDLAVSVGAEAEAWLAKQN